MIVTEISRIPRSIYELNLKKTLLRKSKRFNAGFVRICASITTFLSLFCLRKIKDKPHSIIIVRLNANTNNKMVLIRLLSVIFLVFLQCKDCKDNDNDDRYDHCCDCNVDCSVVSGWCWCWFAW